MRRGLGIALVLAGCLMAAPAWRAGPADNSAAGTGRARQECEEGRGQRRRRRLRRPGRIRFRRIRAMFR